MRFLLSIILASFFFIAPVQGNARNISGKQFAVNIENKTPGTLVNYSAIDKDADAIILCHSRSSISQYRFQSHLSFINSVPAIAWAHFLPGTKNRIQPHLHFKPIQLKLVFPEHYYW